MSQLFHNGEIPSRCDCHPGEFIGRDYKVVKQLGSGSFGLVYKVEDRNGKPYALKLLRLWDVPSDIRQPLIDRFEMEYRTGQIQSHNLVQSYACGFLKGNPYIVMEFCEGGDVTALEGRSDVDYPRYAADILNGLSDLHRNGKVHRDLKPENVLLRADGTAVLTDFGISGDRNHRMTHRNIFGKPDQIFGTYAYMPPEQANRERGGSTVLPTTDIFSFGVLMYQLLTGLLPFGKLETENDLASYLRNVKNGDWNRHVLMSVPGGAAWIPLIEGCLKASWKERIQSTDEALRKVPASSHNRVAPVVQPRPVVASQPVDKHASGTWITVTYGEQYGQEFDIEALISPSGKQLITLGRDSGNIIVLSDYSETVTSRRHATVERSGDGHWILRDGQWIPEVMQWQPSSNGTFLNANEVSQDGVLLSNGDILTVGNIKLKFETH